MPSNENPSFQIAVVGADASGKSTLVTSLSQAGYEAHHVAQDHSFVPDMWRRISAPDVLIYLDVDYETIKARRPKTTFRESDLTEQEHRLAHARQHCHLYLDTSSLQPDEILEQVLHFLESLRS